MIFHGRARYVVLIALSLLYFLLMAGTFNSLGIVLPSMVKDLGLNWAEGGFGFTLLGTACGLASLLPAMLIRKVGVSLTLIIGLVHLIAGFAGMALTRSVLVYDLSAILLGLGFCFCGTVPAVHVISGMFKRRSTALGVYFTIGNLGAVAGPLLYMAAETVTAGDWRRYWLLFGLAALVVGGFAALVTRGGRRAGDASVSDASRVDQDVPGWAMRDALASVQYWVIVFAYTTCLLVNTTMHSFAYQHLMERGLVAANATKLISLSALIGAGAAALAGVIGEKLSPRALTMLSLACLTVASVTLGVGEGAIALGLFVVALAVGLGFSYVSTAMLMHEYFGRRAGLELYSIMTLVSTSAALGPGIGGLVRDHMGSFAGLFYVLGGVSLLMLLAVFAMRRPEPHAARPRSTGDVGFGEIAAAEPVPTLR